MANRRVTSLPKEHPYAMAGCVCLLLASVCAAIAVLYVDSMSGWSNWGFRESVSPEQRAIEATGNSDQGRFLVATGLTVIFFMIGVGVLVVRRSPRTL